MNEDTTIGAKELVAIVRDFPLAEKNVKYAIRWHGRRLRRTAEARHRLARYLARAEGGCDAAVVKQFEDCVSQCIAVEHYAARKLAERQAFYFERHASARAAILSCPEEGLRSVMPNVLIQTFGGAGYLVAEAIRFRRREADGVAGEASDCERAAARVLSALGIPADGNAAATLRARNAEAHVIPALIQKQVFSFLGTGVVGRWCKYVRRGTSGFGYGIVCGAKSVHEALARLVSRDVCCFGLFVASHPDAPIPVLEWLATCGQEEVRAVAARRLQK